MDLTYLPNSGACLLYEHGVLAALKAGCLGQGLAAPLLAARSQWRQMTHPPL